MHRSLLLALALVACHHDAPSKPTTPAPTAPATGEVTCAQVADNMIAVMTKSAKDAPPDEVKQIHDMFATHCDRDGWSADIRSCFAKIAKMEEGEPCADRMTKDQRDAMEHEIGPPANKTAATPPSAAAPAAAAPAPPAGATAAAPAKPTGATTRAPASKPHGAAKPAPKGGAATGGDPCEGGE